MGNVQGLRIAVTTPVQDVLPVPADAVNLHMHGKTTQWETPLVWPAHLLTPGPATRPWRNCAFEGIAKEHEYGALGGADGRKICC